MKSRIELETKTWDLDWNRHVTSRTYEKFGYEGRLSCLEELGFPIASIIANQSSILPIGTEVRFLAQQYSGAKLLVDTELFRTSDNTIHSIQMIRDLAEKPVCDLKTSFQLLDKENQVISITELEIKDEGLIIQLNPLPSSLEPLIHEIQIKYSDMNPFWTVTNEAVWKYFEEGRFLFFKEIVGFDSIHTTDTTTFFMGGEIFIHKLPDPGSNVKIVSWIDKMEKIRFYFRQDLIDVEGRILASMRDEQLFVKLSKSRPCKVPDSFLEITKKFTLNFQ